MKLIEFIQSKLNKRVDIVEEIHDEWVTRDGIRAPADYPALSSFSMPVSVKSGWLGQKRIKIVVLLSGMQC